MEVVGIIGGATPTIMKYPTSQTVDNIGVPQLIPGANSAGLTEATTTGADNMVGINLDTNTYATAQQTDDADPQQLISVIINPGAMIKALLSGGAAEGTALTLYDVTTATTDGLDITTGDNFTSPEYDEGSVWGFDGVNVGHLRAITGTSSTAITVTVAFPRDHVVGDNFLVAPFSPMMGQTVTLTTNLFQVRNDVAVSTSSAALRCVRLRGDTYAGDLGSDGRNASHGLFVSGNHALANVAL
jgi:hypothetical protein